MSKIGFSVKLDSETLKIVDEFRLKNGLKSRSEAFRMLILDHASACKSASSSEDKILEDKREELKTYLRMRKENKSRLDVQIFFGLEPKTEEKYNAEYIKLVKIDFPTSLLEEAKRIGKSIPETIKLMFSRYESRHKEDCEVINQLKLKVQQWIDVARERSEYIINEGIRRATSPHSPPCSPQNQKGSCKQPGPNTTPAKSKNLPENHPN
jgi:hypothetical protein